MIQSLHLQQWVKNLIIFLPLLASHQVIHLQMILNTLVAFCALSLASSAIYLLNDLFDLEVDRSHPIKCRRPLARGLIPIPFAFSIACFLLTAASMLSLVFLPLAVLGGLGVYMITTVLYLMVGKRSALIGIMLLSFLYGLRIIVGYEATGLAYSNWLLGFSFFFFLSLAFMKRYVDSQANVTWSMTQIKKR